MVFKIFRFGETMSFYEYIPDFRIDEWESFFYHYYFIFLFIYLFFLLLLQQEMQN